MSWCRRGSTNSDIAGSATRRSASTRRSSRRASRRTTSSRRARRSGGLVAKTAARPQRSDSSSLWASSRSLRAPPRATTRFSFFIFRFLLFCSRPPTSLTFFVCGRLLEQRCRYSSLFSSLNLGSGIAVFRRCSADSPHRLLPPKQRRLVTFRFFFSAATASSREMVE